MTENLLLTTLKDKSLGKRDESFTLIINKSDKEYFYYTCRQYLVLNFKKQ